MTKRHHRRLQRGPPRYQQRGLSRAWADLPLRAKGLVVVTIPLATLVTAGLLFSATLAADRQAQGAVLRTVEVERQVAQLRILVQASVSGYLLTGQQQYLTTYQTATRDLPAALGRLGRLVGDNPRQVDHLRQIRTLTSRRFAILAAMVASVRANSPPRQRLALLDRNKQLADAVTAQLEAMQAEQQRLLTARQAHARQTRTLILDAIGLSLLLGVAGGTAAMLLFASGVTRRASHLEHNADRLASGLPLLAPLPGNDALGALGRGLDRAAVLLRDRQGALRQAQALLEHVVTWSPMVMFRGILGGTQSCYVSPNTQRLLGYPPEQITTTGDFWPEHLHPEDRGRFTAELAQATRQHHTQLEQEYRFLHHDGSYRWLYGVTRLAYDEADGLVDTLGYVLDVTERWHANQAIREREATLQAIIGASPDIITILAPDGHVRFLSPALQRILGLSPDDSVGDNAFQPTHVHPDDRDGFVQAQQRVLSGQAAEAMVRLRVGHSDGHWVVLESHTRPLGLDGGVVIVARDITDRQQAEQALQAAKLAAEQANQAKSEYLSRMSHELRTPLNAILGFAQLLELDEHRPEQRDSLRHILSGAQHLLGLINEVLDIAAIEAGRLPLSLEPIAVDDVADEAADLIRPLADQHAIHMGGAPTTCHAHVHGDRQRLKQILLNLLSNAVKYNRVGGSVQLACQQVANQRLRISVTDTGPGIAPELLPLLFIPFERLGSEQTGIEGSGLGLPLSQRLAEAMGGTLQVTTTLGQGSTFWVELPLAQAPLEHAQRHHPQPPAEQDRPHQQGPALTVLCIEDNLSNLQLVEQVLGRRPAVTLITAMRPQLGLDLAAQHHPDLVLLDLHLPDLPGTEVLRRLQTDPHTADIPVVILTADARPGLQTRLLDQGARSLLTKPLNVTELLQLLDTIADQHHPAPSAAT